MSIHYSMKNAKKGRRQEQKLLPLPRQALLQIMVTCRLRREKMVPSP
jgi:hypothetical protein